MSLVYIVLLVWIIVIHHLRNRNSKYTPLFPANKVVTRVDPIKEGSDFFSAQYKSNPDSASFFVLCVCVFCLHYLVHNTYVPVYKYIRTA